jgi:Domain of unknown function (DUF4157)
VRKTVAVKSRGTSAAPARAMNRTCACGTHTGGGECDHCKAQKYSRAAVIQSGGDPPPVGRERLQARFDAKFGDERVQQTTGSIAGDIYEQEAEQVARHVAGTSAPAHAATCTAGAAGGPPCSACAADDRAATPPHMEAPAVSASPSTASIVGGLGTGQQLDSSTREFFEPLFGTDLGHVRVHTDSTAAASARAVNALAYTVGHHVVFAKYRYSPATVTGRALLGHELTHVVQQAGMRPGAASIPVLQRATDQPELQIGIAVGQYEQSHPEDESVFGAWNWACLSHFMSGRELSFFMYRIERWRAATNPKVRERLFSELVTTIVPGPLTNTVCGCFPPTWMAELAQWGLSDYPDALAHIKHYLEGGGADYVEDVPRMFAEDAGFKQTIEMLIADAGTPFGQLRDSYPGYSTKNWKYAFGGIDLIEYEILPEQYTSGANFTPAERTAPVRIAISDAYEWHPDEHRAIPCLHTGMEMMKAHGARDFQQVGTGIVRLKVP